MKNIYIKPGVKRTKQTANLKLYLATILDMVPKDGKSIRNRNSDDVYPYIRTDEEDIVVQLGTFYSVHYIGDDSPAVIVTFDTERFGEKSLSKVLDDIKTAVKYILADPVEEKDDE